MAQSLKSQRIIKIFRYDPAVGGDGHFEEFQLEIGNEITTTLLDVLIRLQKEQDPSLAFRYACRVNMCGSCGMVINGRERLACKTNVCDLAVDSEIVIRPLNHLPVVKDLVVDMEPFFRKYEQAVPYFHAAAETKEPAIIKPDSRERVTIGLSTECIQCGCCVSSCTMVNYHDGYAGPAALNRAFTLLADSRDGLFDFRLSQVLGSCYNCRTEFNCTAVCPKEISPTRAIKYIQSQALKHLSRFKAEQDAESSGVKDEKNVLRKPYMEEVAENPRRRHFLRQVTLGLGAAGAMAVGGVAATSVIGPSLKKSAKQWVKLDKMENFKPGAVTTVPVRYEVINGFHKSEVIKPVIVSRKQDNGNIIVFDTGCTHLGCTVHWDETKGGVLCACHGGAFDLMGNVTAGPPSRPLGRYNFKIENGYLFIEVV